MGVYKPECVAAGHTRTSPRSDGYTDCRECREVRKAKDRAHKRMALEAYKLDHGCARCGYDRSPAALHFHHRDPAEKELKPSRLNRLGWSRIWAEVAKCDVLCANCHAEHHESERDPSDTL